MKRLCSALVALIAIACPAFAQDDEKVDPNYEKKVLENAEKIEKEVSKLRGLKYQAPVRKGVSTEAQLKKHLEAELTKAESVEQAEREGKVAKTFGLIPQDFDWLKEQVTLLGDQIAGFYDPEGKKLRLVQKKMAGMNEQQQEAMDDTTMAHELQHALQDQNFDLGRWFSIVEGHSDRTTSWKCVVEGEATFVQMKHMFAKQMPGMDLPDLKTLFDMNRSMADMVPGAKEQMEKLDKLPPYLVKNLTMPYEDGAMFVQKVFNKGGWEAVTKLFTNPPSSTSQVLHPKKFFDREEPVEIVMPDIAKSLKLKSLERTTFGEFNVRLLLEAHGIKEKAAKKLAAAWRGDHYQAVEAEGGECALVWLSTWHDEDTANAIFTAYRDALTSKAFRPGKWELELRGKEMLLVDAPTAELRQKLKRRALARALQDGSLKPTAGFFEKPPVKDFTEANEAEGFGGDGLALGDAVREDDLGVRFRVPTTWKKQERESIKELRDFSRGLWKADSGAELRVLDMPMPFDKDNLSQQFEALVRKGTREFKKNREGERRVGGHDALEVEFEGIVPDGSNLKREAKAVAIERDSMTLLFLLTTPPGKMKGELARMDAALGSIVFSPPPLVGEKVYSAGRVKLATAGDWKPLETKHFELYLENAAEKASIDVARASAGKSLAEDVESVKRVYGKSLVDWTLVRSENLEHDTLGPSVALEFTFKDKSTLYRARALLGVKSGMRYSVTCTSPDAAFEKLRPAFDRAISSMKLGEASQPVKPPVKPTPAPKTDDEPF